MKKIMMLIGAMLACLAMLLVTMPAQATENDDGEGGTKEEVTDPVILARSFCSPSDYTRRQENSFDMPGSHGTMITWTKLWFADCVDPNGPDFGKVTKIRHGIEDSDYWAPYCTQSAYFGGIFANVGSFGGHNPPNKWTSCGYLPHTTNLAGTIVYYNGTENHRCWRTKHEVVWEYYGGGLYTPESLSAERCITDPS